MSSAVAAVILVCDRRRAAILCHDGQGTRFADSSFAIAEPAAWNSLPAYIRIIDSHSAFCRHLKTYLFTVSDGLNLTLIFFYRFFFIGFIFLPYVSMYVRRCWSPVEWRHSKFMMMMMMMMITILHVLHCDENVFALYVRNQILIGLDSPGRSLSMKTTDMYMYEIYTWKTQFKKSATLYVPGGRPENGPLGTMSKACVIVHYIVRKELPK